MCKKRMLVIGLATVLLLVVGAPVSASGDPPPGGRIVFGDNVTLTAGESVNGELLIFGGSLEMEEGSWVDGSLVVLGGSLEMEAGSWVDGDVAVAGGNATVAGTIDGELVVLGGNVHLAETAVVEDNLIIAGGHVDRDEGAVVLGEQVVDFTDLEWDWDGVPVVVPLPIHFGRVVSFPARFERELARITSFPWAYLRASQVLVTTLLMAVLGGLLAVLWPKPAARVGQASIGAVLPALGMGFLTIIVIAALVISICLTAVGLPAGLVAGLAAVFGWLAMGTLIGDRLMNSLASRPVSPFWSAALGTGLLTVVGSLLDLIPCVGWLGGFLVVCVGLGAVILTRFGTRVYPASALTSSALPGDASDA